MPRKDEHKPNMKPEGAEPLSISIVDAKSKAAIETLKKGEDYVLKINSGNKIFRFAVQLL